VPVWDLEITEDTAKEAAETIIASGTGLGNVGTVTSGVVTIEESDGGETSEVTLWAPASRLGIGRIYLSGTVRAGDSVQLYAAPMGGSETLVMNGDPVTANADGYFLFSRNLMATGYWYAAEVDGV
jgi:hypothetical protein